MPSFITLVQDHITNSPRQGISDRDLNPTKTEGTSLVNMALFKYRSLIDLLRYHNKIEIIAAVEQAMPCLLLYQHPMVTFLLLIIH